MDARIVTRMPERSHMNDHSLLIQIPRVPNKKLYLHDLGIRIQAHGVTTILKGQQHVPEAASVLLLSSTSLCRSGIRIVTDLHCVSYLNGCEEREDCAK